MDFKYKNYNVKVTFCDKSWGEKYGQFLFSYLETSKFFTEYIKGKIEIEKRIDEFISTDYKSMSIDSLCSYIESCFYTDEGGGLYRNDQMLEEIIKKLKN